MKNRDKKIKIEIQDAVIDGKKVWFCARNFNGLFCMNIVTEEVKFIGLFPNESYGKERLFDSIKLIGSKIFFIPYMSKAIVVYDIEKNEFKDIPLNKEFFNSQKVTGPFFLATEVYEDNLFMFPTYCSAIIKLNIVSNELDYICNWTKQIESNLYNSEDVFFRRQSILIENRIIIPFCNANAVLEFNCDTLESNVHILGEDKKGYSGICYDGNNFWLSPRETEYLTKWNLETKEIELFKLCEKDKKENSYSYVGVLYHNQKIEIFPAIKEEKKECLEPNILIKKGEYNFVKEEGRHQFYYHINTGKLIIREKNRIKAYELLIHEKEIDLESIFKDKEIIFESSEFNIFHICNLLIEEKTSVVIRK